MVFTHKKMEKAAAKPKPEPKPYRPDRINMSKEDVLKENKIYREKQAKMAEYEAKVDKELREKEGVKKAEPQKEAPAKNVEVNETEESSAEKPAGLDKSKAGSKKKQAKKSK